MPSLKGIFETIAGGAALAGGIVGEVVSGGASTPFLIELAKLAPLLISAGAGLTLSGIGTLIYSGHPNGLATAERNAIAPWRICYGRCRVGGTWIYSNEWGTNFQMFDMVFALCSHPIQSFDMLLFDQSHVAIDTTAVPPSGYAPGSTIGGTSYTPVQQTVQLNSGVGGSVVRSNDVVTVTCPANIPSLVPGDRITLQNVTGDTTLNGTFQVSEIISQVIGSPGSIIFTVLNGGKPADVVNAGQVKTNWVNYGRNVYMEVLLGNQLLGQTFNGMGFGTPWQGDSSSLGSVNLVSPETPRQAGNSPGQSSGSPNPWTLFCSMQGKSAFFLRMQSDAKYFSAGTPQISCHIHGKDDIYDPRLGPCTGIGTATLQSKGSGNYQANDVLTLGGGSGGQVTLTNVDGSGNPTSWVVTNVGTGYAIANGLAATGGHGSGAQFNVTRLTGAEGCNVYTENAALCIADFLSNPVWGYGATYYNSASSATPFNAIDITALIAAANTYDEPVDLASGGTEPRYSCNGQFELTMDRGQILQNMLTSCAGRLLYVGGLYSIQPGSWYGASPAQVNLIDIAGGPFNWKPTVSIRDLFNGCKGTYISPDNKWQMTDFPYYAQDSLHGYDGPLQYGGDINLAADGGVRRWHDIHLPFTISASMAQRIAKIELLRRRNFGTGTFALNMAGIQFVPLDISAATVPFLGWNDYALEVAAVRFRSEKQDEAVVLGIEIDVQDTNENIYDWSIFEELTAQGYQQAIVPALSATEAVPYPWSPGYVAPLNGDALYLAGAAGPGNFGMQVLYANDAQGNATTNLQVLGNPPINALDDEIFPPLVKAVGSATGGSLAGGVYAIGVTAFDSGSPNYANTEYLDLATVSLPVGNTGSITVTVEWGPGNNGGDLYMALINDSAPQAAALINAGQPNADKVFHWQQTLAAGGINEIVTVTLTSFNASTSGGIDTLFDHFAVAWQQVIHTGPWAAQVQAVTATTVTVAGPGMTANQWQGYALSLLAKYDPTIPIPILNMPVASSTASSSSPVEFTLTIGPNSAGHQLVNLTTLLDVGDLVTIRSKFTFTATSMTDPNIANGFYPSGATGVEAGHLSVVMTGADAGDVQTISSVTATAGKYTTFNIAGSWQVTPATGDVVIICAPANSPQVPCNSISVPNKNSLNGVVATPKVDNLASAVWLFRVRTEDVKRNHCLDFIAPCRELFFFGAQGR